MIFSKFGHQLTRPSGIVSLMEDLGDALNVNPDLLFLGGGNPALVESFESIVARHLTEIAATPERLHKLIGVYQSPQGDEVLLAELAQYLRETLGWPVTQANIAVTSGSQSAFFSLFNMLAGEGVKAGSHKHIVLPMLPEYLGYADQGLAPDMFRGFLPKTEITGSNRFKYRIDFDALTLDENSAAICISRPTNPSGNVVSDAEVAQLAVLAEAYNIPLIIDGAYGAPFPNIIYGEARCEWQEGGIYVASLSKLGLPGARTGIVVADEATISRLVSVNTVMCLANNNLGVSIMTALLQSGELDQICAQHLLPFYRAKKDHAVACVDRHLAGLPYYLHEAEGAFFLWLWLDELPISSSEVYRQMKELGVLVMDGAYFFYGVEAPSLHTKQCIRLTYCQSEEVVERGVERLGGLLRELYK